jgi:FtsX-like permease family protein
MRPGTALRLALAGTRTDVARVILTALGAAAATLGLLSVATVLSIHSGPGWRGTTAYAHYTNGLLAQSGLRPGLSFALVLLTLPVLLFVAQCARLGAPARDRRLAAYRMAGATPADTVRVAAAETGVAALLGAALGAAVYFVGRVLADAPNAVGYRPLPTDVLPPPAAIAAVLVGVPVAVVLLTVLLLRRVVFSPFGVVRRVRTKRPPLWPAVLLLIGAGFLAMNGALSGWLFGFAGRNAGLDFLVGVFVALVLVVVGLAFGTASLARALGALLTRHARRPALVLAAGRATTDPWLGSRTVTVLYLATLFGAGAAGMRNAFIAQESNYDVGFFTRALDLISLATQVVLVIAVAGLLVALVESIVSGRRALASAVASGIPRRTLAGAILAQTLLVTTPGVLLATAIGAVAGWGFTPNAAISVKHAEVPWGRLTALVAVAVLAVLVTTGIGLLFLRTSTRASELRTE